jgi:hypothetical protein
VLQAINIEKMKQLLATKEKGNGNKNTFVNVATTDKQ